MRKSQVSAVVVLMLGLFTSAHVGATTCIPLEDRFLFDCRNNACEPLFRARDTPTAGCGRRMVVEAFPKWAIEPATELARASRDTGVWEVTFKISYHPSVMPNGNLERSRRRYRPELTRLDVDPETARRDYERRAAHERRRFTIDRWVYSTIVFLESGLLLFSILLTARACRTNSVRQFIWALSIPATIFGVSWLAFPWSIIDYPYLGAVGLLFTPLIAASTLVAWAIARLVWRLFGNDVKSRQQSVDGPP